MPSLPGSRALGITARWLLGTGLVSWRYMWETTPLHRREEVGDATDRPPALPPEYVDARVLPSSAGHGQLFHRLFRVRVRGARLGADELIDHVARDFKHFVPSEVVDVRTGRLGDTGLQPGDELLVEMPGPWNGPVRVVERERDCLRLATLRRHLEAGQVVFRARSESDLLVFEIELWARASSRLVDLLYSRLRFAKEVQLNMWVRFCLAAAETAGGRPVDGVHISTRRFPQEAA
jgi:hypothetical protein